MTKYLLGFLIVIAGCGKGDKCERAFDKMAPMMKKMADKDDKVDRAKEVEKCHEELKKHPESEKMIDCVLAISGDPTEESMMKCMQEEGVAHKKEDKGGGDTGAMMAKMTEFKDKMCACADTACAQKVSDEMTKWSQEQIKGGAPPKMSEDDTKKATQIATDMGACMQKAMGAK